MSKITDYGALSSTQPDDVLPIVDVHDFTQAGTGSTKKITVGNLLASAGGSNAVVASGDTTGAADSAAVQALYNLGASTIVLGSGTFYLKNLQPASFSRLTGQGRGVTNVSNAGSSKIIDVGHGQTDTVEIDHLSLSATGADIFGGTDANMLRWNVHDCDLIQNSAGNSIMNQTIVAGVMIECNFRRNREYVYGATRTQPAWFISAPSASNACNQNVWRDEVCFDQNSDAAQYWFHIRAVTETNAQNEFDNIVFEHAYGGLIWLESHVGGLISNCQAWDIPGSGGTVGNHLIQITKSSAGGSSVGNTITDSPRNGGTTFAASTYDISLDGNSPQTTIISPQPAGVSINTGGSAVTILSLTSSFTMVSGPTVPGRSTFAVGEGTNAILAVRNLTSAPAAPSVSVEAAAAGDRAIGVRVHGDTNSRAHLLSDGTLAWGSGSAAQDFALSRPSAGVVQFSDGGSAGSITFRAAASSSQVSSTELFQALCNAAGDIAYTAKVTGDTSNRLRVDSSGMIRWGPGNATQDTQLQRTAAGQLAITDNGTGSATLLAITSGLSGAGTSILQLTAHASTDNGLGVQVTGDTSNRVKILPNGSITFGPGNATQDITLSRVSANTLGVSTADLVVETAGRGLQVREGTNCKQGVATLSAGTVTVSNTSVTTTSRIQLTAQDNSSTGALRVSARTAGTSFVITSSNAGDSGVVAYEIFEPAV